ncbi:MAG: mitochondrial 39-S ribosomal protein L47 (MRP-L47)-domain-containing protein [Monoraphidium minutum]|nr:MAG: mitochondrial 39-S ribosomal protein L47 (MRP-L47)-domain-containing protein [Monoraphidium minutum]
MLALLGRRLGAAAAAEAPGACRGISASRAAADLREWLDPDDKADGVTYGRPWMAHELRLKSWDDLHKLWYVCFKERNLVATQMNWAKGKPAADDYQDRYLKVKKTMNRIKQVLSERACQEINPIRQAQMKKAIHLM